MEHRAAMNPISVYREFAPCAELRDYVRAFAWFGPADEATRSRIPTCEFFVGGDTELTPSFADVHPCLLFALGVSYGTTGWHPCSTTDATVMGAMTRATQPPSAERVAMIGAYLRPRGRVALLGVPAADLTDRIIPLSDCWKGFAISRDATSVDKVETLLVRRLSMASTPDRGVRIAKLAAHVSRCGGRVSVSQMAALTGLSRQHLGRLFLEYLGVGPKLYARLARFRTALRHLGNPASVGGWSGLAARLGYTDQSHFIAELREFSSFTPQQLVGGDRFHPFIENR